MVENMETGIVYIGSFDQILSMKIYDRNGDEFGSVAAKSHGKIGIMDYRDMYGLLFSARQKGIQDVTVYIKGRGLGRAQALQTLEYFGFSIQSIHDKVNGASRKKKVKSLVKNR